MTIPGNGGTASRGNGNGNGLSQLPVWARIIALVGLPGALLIYVVYMGGSYLPNMVAKIDNIYSSVMQSRETVMENRQIIRDQFNEQRLKAEAQYKLLQRICVNTAKTEAERTRCFD